MNAELYQELILLGTCECCGNDVKERILVKLPVKLVNCRTVGAKKRLHHRKYAWLCFRCVREYCESTLGSFWKKIIFPKIQ